MARKGGPALYELLSKSKGSGAPGPAIGATSGARATIAAGDGQWLGVLAAAIAVAVIAYFVGVSRGERLGRAAVLAEREEDSQLAESARPAVPQPIAGGESAGGGESGNRPSTGANGFAAAGGAEEVALPPVTDGADPRQPGLNYFILATVADPSARAIADYCRSQGLDARVVKMDNGRFSEVIVLPGFPASERSGPLVKELEARIRKVGVRYKAAGRGNPDFGDMYHKLHRP